MAKIDGGRNNSETTQRYIAAKGTQAGPEWVARRKERRSEREEGGFVSEENIFGSRVLYSKRRVDNPPISVGPDSAVIKMHQLSYERDLRKANENLSSLAHINPRLLGSFLGNFLINSRNYKKVITELGLKSEEFYKKDKDLPQAHQERLYVAIWGNRDYKKLKNVIIDRLKAGMSLPDSVLIPMLERHVKSFEDAKKEAISKYKSELSEIREVVYNAIDSGVLLLDKKVAEERIRTLQILAYDEIIKEIERTRGDYDIDTHIAGISTSSREFKETMMHEIMHCLSGQIESIHTYKVGGKRDYVILKAGLEFDRGKKRLRGSKLLNLRWLDEAVTEKISADLLKIESTTYMAERKLLGLLVNSGISEQSIHAAYFENFSEQPSTHSTPKLQSLFKEINEKLGIGFLYKLDQYINTQVYNGRSSSAAVQATVEKWEELKQDFPEFIEQWASEKNKKASQ